MKKAIYITDVDYIKSIFCIKKYLMFSFFLICSNNFGQILDKSNSWNNLHIDEYTCKGTNCSGEKYYSTHSYFILEDTVTINGKKYNMLMDSVYSLNPHVRWIGYIREDSSQKKVYVINFDYQLTLTKEILIYDFSLNKDSIFYLIKETSLGLQILAEFKVSDTDSVIYYGEKRKRIIFENKVEWIEGIGSKNGFLYDILYPSDSIYTLLCFKHNNELKYKNDLGYDCIYVKPNVSIKSKKIDEIDIYPYPSIKNTFRVRSNTIIRKICVYNIFGRRIIQLFPNCSLYNLTLTDIPSGIYFINVDNKLKKIIID